jgi:hypothetical protein
VRLVDIVHFNLIDPHYMDNYGMWSHTLRVSGVYLNLYIDNLLDQSIISSTHGAMFIVLKFLCCLLIQPLLLVSLFSLCCLFPIPTLMSGLLILEHLIIWLWIKPYFFLLMNVTPSKYLLMMIDI